MDEDLQFGKLKLLKEIYKRKNLKKDNITTENEGFSYFFFFFNEPIKRPEL